MVASGRQAAYLVLLVFMAQDAFAKLPPWSWEHVQSWSMPHFTPNPIPAVDLANFTRFNMTNFCCNGLLHGNGTAFDMIPNEEQNSLKVAADMKATNPHAHVSPYIGFEMGQSWFKAQVRAYDLLFPRFIQPPPLIASPLNFRRRTST